MVAVFCCRMTKCVKGFPGIVAAQERELVMARERGRVRNGPIEW